MNESDASCFIIPAIDIRNARCVRLEQGDYSRQTIYRASPVQMAEQWEASGASLIHVVDLDGAKVGAPRNLDTVKRICESVSCPIELGGGLRSDDDIQRALDIGVSRVVLGTTAASKPEMVAHFIERFGERQIVVSLDARDGNVAIHGWRESTTASTSDLAATLSGYGLRHVIYTDIATDGMFTGPNLDSVRALCEVLPRCEVISSGGIASTDHVRSLLDLGLANLRGVIVGKALYDGRVTFEELCRS